ncbi:hydrogenase [Pelosinus sp. sgz500959]|uniref:hydrogenase n=1 Tax=Pelosinus sp. sgz500959 TaxID=3242472 RepID=UPI00366FEF9C
MNILTILLLFTALLLTRVSRLSTAVNLILAQSFMVALACAAVGIETGAVHMYIGAALTAVVKVGLIPYGLMNIVDNLQHESEDHPILNMNYSAAAACIAIVLAYSLIDKALPGAGSRDALATAVAMTLIGLLLIMTRRQAVMQIVGLITMENGIYLVGLSVTKGLPLIIELGVFFDVLVAVVVLGILTYRLKLSGISTDTSMLKKLKG